MGLFNAILSLIYDLLRAVYFKLFKMIDIKFLRLFNYSLGKSVGIFLFYLFAGTFLLFLISIIALIFTKKRKYIELLRILFYAVTPVYLFYWLSPTIIPLLIWALFLYFQGLSELKIIKKTKKIKNTIFQRE